MRLPNSSTCCMVALVVLLAPAVGCAKQGEDPLLANVPQDADVVVVVKDVTTMDAKIGEMVTQLVPAQMGMPPGGPKIMEEMLSGLVHDVTYIKPGSPLVMAIRFRESIKQNPLMVQLVALTDLKNVTGESRPDADGVYELKYGRCCAAYHGMAMIGSRESVAAMRTSAAGLTLNAEQKQMWSGADVYALVDLKAVVKAFTPLYEEYHGGMAQALKAAEGNAEAADQAAAMKAKVGQLETLWGYAQQMDWAAGGASLGKAGADVQVAVGVTPGGHLASLMNGHPALGDRLTPSLPVVDGTWGAAWYSMDSRKAADAMAEYFAAIKCFLGLIGDQMRGPMMGPGPDPTKLVEVLDKAEDVFRNKLTLMPSKGGGLVMTGAGGAMFNTLMAEEVADRETYLKRTEQMVNLSKDMAAASFSMMMFGGGGDAKVETSFKRDVQKVGDLSVDQSTVKITFPPKADGAIGPDMSKLFQGILGGDTLTTWTAYSDGYSLTAFGPSPAHLPALAEAVKGGGGLAASPEIVALRAHTLKDANMVVYMSVSRYLTLVMGAMMQAMSDQPVQLPPMPPEAGTIQSAMSIAAGNNRVAFRVYVPTSEMQQIMQNVMMMQMTMMQQMQPPPPAPQPGGGEAPLM